MQIIDRVVEWLSHAGNHAGYHAANRLRALKVTGSIPVDFIAHTPCVEMLVVFY